VRSHELETIECDCDVFYALILFAGYEMGDIQWPAQSEVFKEREVKDIFLRS
jgi:hypothetical protein